MEMVMLEKIYQNSNLLNKIYAAVDGARERISNTAKLEESIMKRIIRYANNDDSKLNHVNILTKFIYEEVARQSKRDEKSSYALYDDLTYYGDDGSEVTFEPIDEVTDVLSEITRNETIAELSRDSRRQLILQMWSIGYTNDEAASREVAAVLGGSASSHRRFIQRFRDECRTALNGGEAL